jgi:hypothetical protein
VRTARLRGAPDGCDEGQRCGEGGEGASVSQRKVPQRPPAASRINGELRVQLSNRHADRRQYSHQPKWAPASASAATSHINPLASGSGQSCRVSINYASRRWCRILQERRTQAGCCGGLRPSQVCTRSSPQCVWLQEGKVVGTHRPRSQHRGIWPAKSGHGAACDACTADRREQGRSGGRHQLRHRRHRVNHLSTVHNLPSAARLAKT